VIGVKNQKKEKRRKDYHIGAINIPNPKPTITTVTNLSILLSLI
jgi:hypothetical protein